MAEKKTEPKLTDAAAKTTAVMQTLQSRLHREAAPAEPADDLGEQLRRYFATPGGVPPPAKVPAEIQNLVIEGVVDRILLAWGEPNGQLAAIKSAVIARLVERVLAELLKKGTVAGSEPSRQ